MHTSALWEYLGVSPGWARPPQYYTDSLADDNAALLVAEWDGRAVGVVHAYLPGTGASARAGGRRYVEIDMLADGCTSSSPVTLPCDIGSSRCGTVTSGSRRRGVGRALLAATRAWAGERGAEDLRLTVWEFNVGARAFYEALANETVSRKLRLRLAGGAVAERS